MRRPSTDKLAAAIEKARGNVAAAARSIGCSRNVLFMWIKDCPQLIAIRDNARETMVDIAESKLEMAVAGGEQWAVAFVLKTLGRNRGYTEAHALEHSGPGGGPIQQQVAGQLDHLLTLTDEEAAEMVARADRASAEADGCSLEP